MKKKILAVALAAMMVVSSAVSAFAATIADVNATGWWVDHTESIEVTADGVTVTFTSTTDSSASSNWNTPLYVVYTGDEAFAGGSGLSDLAGYSEYFVCRSDVYAWEGAALGIGNSNDGFTSTATFTVNSAPADDTEWATWLEECKAGVSGTLEASLSDGVVTVTMTVNGVSSTATIPVGSITPYISLTGELCTITGITTSTGSTGNTEGSTEATEASSEAEKNPDTSDVANFAAVAIVVAAAAAIVVLKKRVTE